MREPHCRLVLLAWEIGGEVGKSAGKNEGGLASGRRSDSRVPLGFPGTFSITPGSSALQLPPSRRLPSVRSHAIRTSPCACSLICVCALFSGRGGNRDLLRCWWWQCICSEPFFSIASFLAPAFTPTQLHAHPPLPHRHFRSVASSWCRHSCRCPFRFLLSVTLTHSRAPLAPFAFICIYPAGRNSAVRAAAEQLKQPGTVRARACDVLRRQRKLCNRIFCLLPNLLLLRWLPRRLSPLPLAAVWLAF